MLKRGIFTYFLLTLMLFEVIKEKTPDLLVSIGRVFRVNSLIATKVKPHTIDKNIPSVLDVPAMNMRKAMNEAYRLRPDKRLLLSIAEIHGFITGKRKAAAIAEYDGGVWRISYDGIDVGTLKENPEFPDFVKLLTGWIEKLNAIQPLPLPPSAPLAPDIQAKVDSLGNIVSPDLIKNLGEIDQLWRKGERNPIFLRTSMRTLVFLSMQNLDKMGVADRLPARALAFLVLAKVLTRYDTSPEECLLAHIMHYSAESVRLAKLLPTNDPIKAFILLDDDSLKSLAEVEGGSPETRYLWLVRLAAMGKWEDWSLWLDTAFGEYPLSLPLLISGLDMSRFTGKVNYSILIGQTILYQLLREKLSVELLIKTRIKYFLENQNFVDELYPILGIDSSTIGQLIGIYESNLGAMADEYRGPFFDRDTFMAYYQSHFYTMLYSLGIHYLDELSSLEAAQEYLKQLKSAMTFAVKLKSFHIDFDNQPSVNNFIRWYGDLVSSKAGKRNTQRLLEDLVDFPSFGAKPLLRTLKDAKKHFKNGDPALLISIKRMMVQMDNRPVHVYQLASWGYSDLYDLRLAEQSYRYVSQTDAPRQAEAHLFYLSFIGQKDHLIHYLRETGVSVNSKLYALSLVRSGKAGSESLLRKEYEQLVRQNPDNWHVRNKYADYLVEREDYEYARKILEQWLAKELITEGLENILFLNKIAETYYLQNRYDEGLKVIVKIIPGMHGGTLRIAGKLLDKMGDKDNAEQLFAGAYSRYGDSMKNTLPLISFYWRHARYEDAASALHSIKYAITPEEWRREIVPAFAAIFKELTEQETMAAFSAILARKPDPLHLSELASSIYLAGNPKLAFEMQSLVKGGGSGLEQMNLDLGAYKYLKAGQGEDYALNWLKKRIPITPESPVALFIFTSDDPSLLWSFVKSPDEYGWLLRAAISIKKSFNLSERDRKALSLYFKIAKEGFYNTIGLYLLGLADEDRLFEMAVNPRKRCEIAYFIGYKAEQEGRLDDASDWYRVAFETGFAQNFENRWAISTLHKWRSKGVSLARLAKNDFIIPDLKSEE